MKETVESIQSTRLKNERSVWVREPANPSEARHVTLFLDGELYRDRMGTVSLIEKLNGSISDSWFVFVSMGSPEARWTELPCYPPFAGFVVEELLPWLAKRFPGIEAAGQRTIAGVSYSGLAAAFIAKEYPGIFQKVISQSGSFWSDECRLVDEFRTLSAPVPTDFYLDVGVRETQENVRHREDVLQRVSQIEGVRKFRDALLERGHTVRYLEFEGGHECAAWQRTLEGALKWALPNLPVQPTPRSVTTRTD